MAASPDLEVPVRPSHPRRLVAGLTAVLGLAMAGAGPAAAVGTAPAADFGTAPAADFDTAPAADFGTAPVTGPGRSGTGLSVRDVTVGRQEAFDRVVFTAVNGLPSWEVRYVPSVAMDGSGEPVPLDGGAALLVVLHGTDWTGQPSVRRTLAPGFPGLRQVAWAGEFEGDLSYGVGQATRTGFHAFALTGPDRLVVDVAHPASEGGSRPTTAAPSRLPTTAPASTGTGPAAATTGSPVAVGDDPGGLDGTGLIVIGGIVAVLGALGVLGAVFARRRP